MWCPRGVVLPTFDPSGPSAWKTLYPFKSPAPAPPPPGSPPQAHQGEPTAPPTAGSSSLSPKAGWWAGKSGGLINMLDIHLKYPISNIRHIFNEHLRVQAQSWHLASDTHLRHHVRVCTEWPCHLMFTSSLFSGIRFLFYSV